MMVEKETIINLVVYFKQEREMKVMHGANEHKQTERNRETESEVREIRRQRERNRETESEVREIRRQRERNREIEREVREIR